MPKACFPAAAGTCPGRAPLVAALHRAAGLDRLNAGLGAAPRTAAERAVPAQTLARRLGTGRREGAAAAASLNAPAARIKAESPRGLGTAALVD